MVKATDSTDSPSTDWAEIFTVIVPLVVGMPVMVPVAVLMANPAGRPPEPHIVAGRDAASRAGVTLNASPTLPVKVWPAVMMGAPLPSTRLNSATELVPPGPVAVSDMGKVPEVVGMPVTSPVAELRVAHGGRETVAQDVTGRLPVSLAVYFFEKGTPTLPVNVCPAGMLGTPAAMVNVTGVTALVPAKPETTKFAVIVPLVVGVPVMVPLGALNTSPTGRPVMAHDLAGRSS
jgi:hypothetical protein